MLRLATYTLLPLCSQVSGNSGPTISSARSVARQTPVRVALGGAVVGGEVITSGLFGTGVGAGGLGIRKTDVGGGEPKTFGLFGTGVGAGGLGIRKTDVGGGEVITGGLFGNTVGAGGLGKKGAWPEEVRCPESQTNPPIATSMTRESTIIDCFIVLSIVLPLVFVSTREVFGL